jgi:hypothetical protein
MFCVLMEATTTSENHRGAGSRHPVIVMLNAAGASVEDARRELEARGWTDVVANRIGEVVDLDHFPPGDPVRLAVADAADGGFGCVVYEQPIKPS